MGRKRGSRFRKAIDAQEQYESILEKQRSARKKKRRGTLIERTDKSKRREKNAYNQLRRKDDIEGEFD